MSTLHPEAEPFWVNLRSDRDYHAWCRARALELALKATPEGMRGDLQWLFSVADDMHAYIDEGRTDMGAED